MAKKITKFLKKVGYLKALTLVFIAAIVALLGYNLKTLKAQTGDEARSAFIIEKYSDRQIPSIEIDSNGQLSQLSALTGQVTLNTIMLGANGEPEDAYYSWSVKKLRGKSAESLSSFSGEKDKMNTDDVLDDSEYEYNAKIQSMLAGGKINDKYGELVLVELTPIKVKRVEKEPKGFAGDNQGITNWQSTDYNSDEVPAQIKNDRIQYFDRLKLENGQWVSKYDDWARDKGLRTGKDSDADNDGYKANFGGNEGESGVANSEVDWAKLRTDWSNVFCGNVHTQKITAKKDGKTLVLDPPLNQESEYYCVTGLFGYAKHPCYDLDNKKCYDSTDYSIAQNWLNDAKNQGKDITHEYYDPADKANVSALGHKITVCGASGEFQRGWEENWKTYRNEEGELKALNYRESIDACRKAASGKYERNSNFVNLSNCFLRDPDTGKETQVGCFHKFANVKDTSSGKYYESGDGNFTNYEEFVWGTDPSSADTDGDGVKDEGDIVGHSQKTAQLNLSDLKGSGNESGSTSDTTSFVFKVDVETSSQVAQRAIKPPVTSLEAKTAYRIYYASDIEGADTDIKSKVKVGVKVSPTFPNIREDVIWQASVESAGLPVASPDQLRYNWLIDQGSDPGSVTASKLVKSEVGVDRYTQKIPEVGHLRMTVHVYLINGNGAGKDKFLGQASAEASVLPGFRLKTNASNSENCYRKGQVAKITPVTQKRNGEPVYDWFVDGERYQKTGPLAKAEPGKTVAFIDWNRFWQNNKTGSDTDEVEMGDYGVEFPVNKEVGENYLVQLVYTTSDSLDEPNHAVVGTKIQVCDPGEGTSIIVRESNDKFDYRAGTIGDPVRMLGEQGATAKLGVKLGPLLSEAPLDLTYDWKVTLDGADASKAPTNLAKNSEVDFQLTEKPGTKYNVELTIKDDRSPENPIVLKAEIEVVENLQKIKEGLAGQSTSASKTPPRPKDLTSLIDNLRNFRTLTIPRMIETLFRLGLILAAILAAIMIAMGGFSYLTSAASANVGAAAQAKEQVTSAIFGLLIAFVGWALLNTINPDILSLRTLSLPKPEQTQSTTTQQTTPVKCSALSDCKSAEYCEKTTGKCLTRVKIGDKCDTKNAGMCVTGSVCQVASGTQGVCRKKQP